MTTKKEQGTRTTLSVDQRVKDVLVPRMDIPIFSGMQNMDRMLLAMAIGYHAGLAPSLSSRNDGGYVRRESLSQRFFTLGRIVRFAEAGYEDADALQDDNATFDLIERYANGGFQLIEGDLDDNMTSEEIANNFVRDMDELYQRYTGNKAY